MWGGTERPRYGLHSVRSTTPSGRSAHYSLRAPKGMSQLTEWKLAQKPERRQADSLVVTTKAGEPLSASSFLAREFYPALTAAKLPRVVFHRLCQTASTILASSNTPPGTV